MPAASQIAFPSMRSWHVGTTFSSVCRTPLANLPCIRTVNEPVAKPTFFLVGAPKCGTTALYAYLQKHPGLFLPPKEQHFFGSDLYPPERPHDEADYLRPFASAPAGVQLGEASVWYLYSRLAAQEIKRFSPEGRIIVSLRNPVDMIYSLHSHVTWAGIERVQPFERAIRMEMDTGRPLPF